MFPMTDSFPNANTLEWLEKAAKAAYERMIVNVGLAYMDHGWEKQTPKLRRDWKYVAAAAISTYKELEYAATKQAIERQGYEEALPVPGVRETPLVDPQRHDGEQHAP